MDSKRRFLLDSLGIYELNEGWLPAKGEGSGRARNATKDYKTSDYGNNPKQYISDYAGKTKSRNMTPEEKENYDLKQEIKRRERIRDNKIMKAKLKMGDVASKHGGKIALGTAAAAGIAYGIKKLRDRRKEKKRLQNPHTQNRLQRSNPNEFYYNNIDRFKRLNEGWGNKIKFATGIGGAIAAGVSLYKSFTSSSDMTRSGDITRSANYMGNTLNNLAPHLEKKLSTNIIKIHEIIPKKLITDVMFSDNIDGNAVIIINNENELCRHFASKSYNNKTNEGIIFYVLERLKQNNLDYNIITYDFFTKYYSRSLTKALSDNKGNTNCYNCNRCNQCEFCIDCISCNNCKYCIDCTNCRALENADKKRNQTGNNFVDNNDSSQQLASQYGITPRDVEMQIVTIRRRQNADRLIINRSYQDKRERDRELAKLPKTDKEFREMAIQELISKKGKR